MYIDTQAWNMQGSALYVAELCIYPYLSVGMEIFFGNIACIWDLLYTMEMCNNILLSTFIELISECIMPLCLLLLAVCNSATVTSSQWSTNSWLWTEGTVMRLGLVILSNGLHDIRVTDIILIGLNELGLDSFMIVVEGLGNVLNNHYILNSSYIELFLWTKT